MSPFRGWEPQGGLLADLLEGPSLGRIHVDAVVVQARRRYLITRPLKRARRNGDPLKDPLCFLMDGALWSATNKTQPSTQSIRSLVDHVSARDVHHFQPNAQ
jgi:hypothetical protein